MKSKTSYRMPTVTLPTAMFQWTSQTSTKQYLEGAKGWYAWRRPFENTYWTERALDELKYRLQHLHPEEMELLSGVHRKALIHLASCRTYPFLRKWIQVPWKVLFLTWLYKVYELNVSGNRTQLVLKLKLSSVSKNQIEEPFIVFW